MAASKRNIISVILALALVGGAWATEPNSTRQPSAPLSNTRYASCIVNITADPEILPVASQTAMNLLIMSSAVGAKAARDELGVNEAAISKVFQAMSIELLTDSSRLGGGQLGWSRRGPFDRGPNGELVALDANDAGARPGSRPTSTPRGRSGFESATFRIAVTLPNDVKPAAEEFVKAVVENLRASLQSAHSQYSTETHSQLEMVRDQRDKAKRELEDTVGLRTDPTVGRQIDQLNTLVDMSKLTPETSFVEAIDMLRKSVNPPLNIVVLWRNLEEARAITQDIPIRMEGPASAGVKTVLELLFKAVSPSGEPPITYRWEGQVLTIGTPEWLGGGQMGDEQFAVPIDVLKNRRYDLDNQIQQVEMNLAAADAKRQAMEAQITQLRAQASKRLTEDEVSKELQTIVQGNEEALDTMKKLVATGRLSEGDLAKARESLARARIDLAKRKEELAKAVGGGQLEAYSAQISDMAIETAQNKAKIEMLRRRLSETERQLAQASAADLRTQRARSIQESINVLDQRINDLQIRQANTQPPTVTVIGAD